MTEAARRNELRALVRRATRMWIASLAASLAPSPVSAAPFPAEIDLADLDPANGGDGSVGVLLEGLTPNDQKGWAVAGAGDIDGDGFDDMLAGALGDGACDRCAAFIALGRAQLAPSIHLLRDAFESDGADAFLFRTLAPEDLGGFAVSGIGDLNGDGFDDFAVGAPDAAPDGADAAGEVYVVFGRDTGYPASFDAETLLPANGGDGSEGFILSGVVSFDKVGWSVKGGCDVNGDGLSDLLLGSPLTYSGKAYLIFGRTSGFPPQFGLARLLPQNGGDGSEGVIIQGIDNGDGAGYSLACLGDTNGDGFDDMLIGAPHADAGGVNRSGEVYLLFGHGGAFEPTLSLSTLLPANGGDGSAGSVLKGIDTEDGAGAALGSAGDLNGDGLADMIIGAPFAGPNGAYSGRVFVVFGRADGFPPEFGLARLLPANGGDGREGFVLNGPAPYDIAGSIVAGVGDVSGDDIPDLVVSAPYGYGPAGRAGAFVVFGQSGGFAAEFELASLLEANGGDGTQGFAVFGARAGDNAGIGLAGAGDVNGDRAADLLVGAPGANQNGLNDTGNAYLIYGRVADGDADGVSDSQDNCSALANADQRDTDDDGFGNACDADLNNDCTVNFTDLGELKAVFFTSDPDADFNGDGAVNFTDLGTMKATFFLPPGPSGVPNACDAR